MSPKVHHVTSSKFAPVDFDGKQLRWFRRETPQDFGLRVADVRSDSSFILWAAGNAVLVSNQAPGTEGQIAVPPEKSLDQGTVDKIERADTGALQSGCDFVIFEDSPKTLELCRRRAKAAE